ncbi:MAG TPA: hypothetical protein VFQ25_07660 [Ktedonobacterales bacterium]|nr:hypothetical protein [Ktedonobacterales bacterium]
MKSLCTAFTRIALLIGTLTLAACAGGTSTGGASSGGASSTAAPAATATSRPKPTSAPQVTQAFCESVMSVADANQIMHPPAPITAIHAQSNDALGVCAYTSPQSPLPVVKVVIEQKPYTGPKPVPTSTILQLASEAANESHITVTTLTPVSGVGDQAEFLAAHLSQDGQTFYADAFYVIYGKVLFLCVDFHLNTTQPDDATQQTALQQCAERVVPHL